MEVHATMVSVEEKIINNMEKERIIILIIIVLSWTFWGIKKSAQDNVKKIGFNSLFYPRRYVILPRWLRKQFRIEQHMVPRFLFFEMIFANLDIVYAVIMVFYLLFSKGQLNYFLFMIPLIICPIEIIISSIITHIYLHSGIDNRKSE